LTQSTIHFRTVTIIFERQRGCIDLMMSVSAQSGQADRPRKVRRREAADQMCNGGTEVFAAMQAGIPRRSTAPPAQKRPESSKNPLATAWESSKQPPQGVPARFGGTPLCAFLKTGRSGPRSFRTS
jgi:hypothetical protein